MCWWRNANVFFFFWSGGGEQALGLDVEQMLLCQPDSGEMALEVADSLVRSNAVSLIAIDSVAALVPRSEIEGEIGTFQGAHIDLRCRLLRPLRPSSHLGCHLVLPVLSQSLSSPFSHMTAGPQFQWDRFQLCLAGAL